MPDGSTRQGSWTILLDKDEARPTTAVGRDLESPFAPWQLLGICDPRHPLVAMADSVAWVELIALVTRDLPSRTKWPSRNLRLILGLLMLSGGAETNEEETIARFEENIYWQYFCGLREVQWRCDATPRVLARWKSLLTDSGWASLLDLDVDRNRDLDHLADHLGGPVKF